MKIIIIICSLFICSTAYGFGYLEAIGAAAIKSRAASDQAGYLNKARNNTECSMRYQ